MSILKTYFYQNHDFSGSHDGNLETKFLLFYERCDQAVISPDQRHLPFSAMLTRSALNVSLTHIKRSRGTHREMSAKIKERFITHESILTLTREWKSMSLR